MLTNVSMVLCSKFEITTVLTVSRIGSELIFSHFICSFNVIYKSYRQVLTPVNNSQLLLKLAILDKFRGLYYKTLRIRNLRENVIFQNKLVTLARTNTLLLEQTNTLAYYGVRRLRISNFL